MPSFDHLAKKETIVPGLIVLVLFSLVLANLVPSAPLAPGTVLYEKNNFGYQPVMTTKASNVVRIHKQAGNFIQVQIDTPPARLWVPAQALPGRHSLPAQLFLRTQAGQLGPTLPPFVEKHLTIRYGNDEKPGQPSSQHSSVHVLFSLFLLAVLMLSMKSQAVKNSLAVLIGCFVLFYSVYASGLVKSSLESPQAGIVRILDLVRTGPGMQIYCQSEDLRTIVHSRHGNNITASPVSAMPAASRGYLLTRSPAGAGWKLIATDGTVQLYYRD
ncbi:MAG TPA: hypothetical protein PLM00_06960 [Spirochaetota bacterium]|nr:hypothetical protein [Spirochaetota bacterium]HPH01925.1 hypothetical protein [Spirochaetota bacterium]HPN83116.1 hypothetical protein [Spirochaetota bacterium]